MKKAKITEIFSSIQGEGVYVGEEQAFVRFYGCNLECKFCDEREKWVFSEYTVSEVVDKILREQKESISLTGGEPLMQSGFLKEMLPVLKEHGFRIYLETNGTLKDELLKILDFVDIISMDIKLPSSSGLKGFWQEHTDFLKEGIKKDIFVKTVVTGETLVSDIKEAVSIVAAIDKDIPFIIQPVTPLTLTLPPSPFPLPIGERVRVRGRGKGEGEFFALAKERLNNVRIIPQMHKILGAR